MIEKHILNWLDKESDEFIKNTGHKPDLLFMTKEDFKEYEIQPERAAHLQRSENPEGLSESVQAFRKSFKQSEFMERVMTPEKRAFSVFIIKTEYELNLTGLQYKIFIASSAMALKSQRH